MERTIIGRPFEQGNPGRPKGSVGGRARALMILDSMLAEEANLTKLRDALQVNFDKNPVHFFRQIIMPLVPHEAVLKMVDSTPTVVRWTSLLETCRLIENIPRSCATSPDTPAGSP